MRVPTIKLVQNNFTNVTPGYTLYKERTEAHEAFQYIEIACNGKSCSHDLIGIAFIRTICVSF